MEPLYLAPCINISPHFDQPIVIEMPQQEVKSPSHETPIEERDEVNLKWFHGQDASSKSFIVENYLRQVPCIPIWVEPGESVVDFLSNWVHAIQKLRPDWKKLPPNYLEILKQSDYLFILQDIRLHHLNILSDIGKHLKCLVLSTKQLNKTSKHCTFSKLAASQLIEQLNGSTQLLQLHQHESYSSNRLFLSIAIKAHQKQGQEFIDSWSKYAHDNFNPSFITFFINHLKKEGVEIEELALLANAKVKRTFLKSEIDTLKEYHLLQSDEDFIYFPEEVKEAFQSYASEVKINNLCTEFQKVTGHLFSEETKWIIPHVNSLYKMHQTHCPDSLCFPLFCLMFAAGHFYTQMDDEQKIGPTAAKKISVQARNAIEAIVNRYYGCNITREQPKGLFSTPNYQQIVDGMNKIHPHLAHLYINLQYQIGRIYSYMKDPDQKLGSKKILEFAKQLALHLKYDGKQTLLLKLIDRSGLFYHLNEDNKHDEVIKGYEMLLEEGEVINLEYHQAPVCIDLQKDSLFQINCLEYCLFNMTQQNPIQLEKVKEYINKLVKVCESLKSHEKIRPVLNLVKVFLKIKEASLADKFLQQLEGEKLNTLNQLQVIESQIELNILKGKVCEASQYAKEYRKVAAGYYPSGYYAIYQYIPYEFEENCNLDQEFRSLIAKAENEAQRKIIWDYHPEGYVEKINKNGLTVTRRNTKKPLLLLKNGDKSKSSKALRKQMGEWKVIEVWVDEEVHKKPVCNPSSQKSAAHEQNIGITHQITCGNNKLILGDNMYSYLSKNGRLVEVIDLLKDEKMFCGSMFGAQGAYRLELERVRSPKSDSDRDQFLAEMKKDSGEWGEFYDYYKNCKANFLGINKEKLKVPAEEVIDVVNAIWQMELFQTAKPFKTHLKTTHLPSCVVDQIHFRSFAAFAYHAIKHLSDAKVLDSSIFEKTDDGCLFLSKKFEEIARQYLQNARQLIKESVWKLELPDQRDDSITNCTYFNPKDSSDNNAETIFNTLPEIPVYKRKIKAIKIELENLRYQISPHDEVKRLSEEIEKLREKLIFSQSILEEKVSSTNTDIVAVSVKRDEGLASICIKTYFRKKEIKLHKGFEIIDLRTSMESINDTYNFAS